MKRFTKFILESIEQEELDEAVEVRHDRYMRSHGKKASGGTGSWMFTHKAMGDVDHKNEKEVYSAPSGKFSDAKKAAQQWAKKHGHSTVYVMEEVELDEKLAAHTVRGDTYVGVPDRIVAQAKDKVKKMNPSTASDHQKAMNKVLSDMGWEMTVGGKYVMEEVELDEKYEPELSDEKFDKVVSTKGVFASHDRKGGVHFSKGGKSLGFKMHPHGRAGAEHVHTWLQNMGFKKQGTNHFGVDYYKEEFELDEKYKDPWKAPRKGSSAWHATQQRKKADRDPEEVKRVNAIGNKNHMVGTAKVTHNEEVELDEVSDKMLDRYRQKAFADQPAGDDGSDKYRKRKFGRDLAFAKQTGRARVLATKEEFDLTESHFNVGDRVRCVRSGMSGTVVKSDKPEVGKYYTVKQDSGKLMKYAPNELKAM